MNLAVLASGAGTNLQALLDRVHGRDGIAIVAVASDKPESPALARAQRAGVETAVFPSSGFGSRQERDAAMAGWLAERDVELVVLAGYMQLLSAEFLEPFRARVINVHPALLPAFPGLHAVEQALQYGVKVFGVTVHFVDEGVDSGPIILQRSVEIPDAQDADRVLDRLHAIEHELLPQAVRLIAAGAVSFDPSNPRRVVIEGGTGAGAGGAAVDSDAVEGAAAPDSDAVEGAAAPAGDAVEGAAAPAGGAHRQGRSIESDGHGAGH